MATDNQIKYYKGLCTQLGQEYEDSFENMTDKEASQAIREMRELIKERR